MGNDADQNELLDVGFSAITIAGLDSNRSAIYAAVQPNGRFGDGHHRSKGLVRNHLTASVIADM